MQDRQRTSHKVGTYRQRIQLTNVRALPRQPEPGMIKGDIQTGNRKLHEMTGWSVEFSAKRVGGLL